MFDKLIESEPEGADFKTRRSYFMVSSFVVGVLFLAALVFSIFAADFSLGSRSFDLVEMIAPPKMAAVEPETPRPQPHVANAQSHIPGRVINMPTVEDSTIVPNTISVIPNTSVTRPQVPFDIGPVNTDAVNPGTSGRDSNNPGSDGGLSTSPQAAETVKDPEPPPVIKAPAAKPKVSGGVLNGKATSLPKPAYSAAAKAVRAYGKVDVQVTIDETGKVISANAISGHPLLQSAAEQAAWRARFTPTYLTDVAVKVTGVIVYNFTL